MKNTFTDLLMLKHTLFARNNITALIMRVSQVYLLILISALVTMASPKGNGQSIETTTVKLEIVNKPLKHALIEIEKQTYFRFQWDVAIEKSFPKGNLPEGKYSVKDALDRLLQNTRLNYRQNKAHIIIIPSEEGEKRSKNISDEKTDLADANSVALVTGAVKDAKTNEPLAGVNIIVKGTTRGTTTGVDGRFSIEADDDEILVFSFIGFQSFETSIAGRSMIDVSMEVDVTALKEVEINAGYWDVKQREKTGNISRVTSEEINSQPVSNPIAALVGRMAGVSITQATGVPGDGFKIQIRGRNSLRGGTANDPLYIVDGMPFNSASLSFPSTVSVSAPSPLNSINPSDIESIEVLKDADATAIYGSRGANGVVLITTKKGKSGKLSLDVNANSGFGKVTRAMDLLNTEQYVRMRKEAFVNDGVVPTQANAPDLLLWDTTRNTDWQQLLIGNTARYTNLKTSLSAGNENTKFLFGGGYNRQTTVFPGDFLYQKGSSLFNLGHRTTNGKFKIDLSINYVIERNFLPSADLSVLSLTLPPNAPAIYDDQGNLNWENGTWSNPFASLKRIYELNSNNLITNSKFAYEIFSGLSLKANLGFNTINLREKLLTTIASQNPAGTPQGRSNLGSASLKTWIAEPQIEYVKNISRGKLDVLLGTTFQQSINDKQFISASGYTDDTQLENISAAASLTSVLGTDYSQYRYAALFGRINFNWESKYLINFTARRDGSSRFGPGKQFANFGAIGAAWIFSNEKWFKNKSTIISFGKLRASYGTTGSDQIGDYQYLDTYSSTTYLYQGGKGLIPNRLVNPDFAWEINRKLEGALEIGLFNDKILFELAYYKNRSSNQLVGYPLPGITGFNSIQYNLPATVENSGLEIQINSIVVQTGSFKWSSSVNFSQPRNKLIEYENIEGSTYANVYKVGESLFIQKRYRYTGVDSETGTYTFEDFDGNGTLSNSTDTQFRKERSINFHGGVTNSFSYKGIHVDIHFQFVAQTGSSYLATVFAQPGARTSNQPTLVMDRWQQSGDVTEIQKFTQGGIAATAYTDARVWGDNTITDASFLRLKNLAISWELPQGWKNRILLNNARVYVQGQNLLTFTKYDVSDPETQSLRTLPPLSVVTFGFQITL